MAFLIEETKGAFPLWLSPVQVNIIPVNNEYHLKYAEKVMEQLSDKNIRVKLDDKDEKLSYKMRESQSHKIPYTVIIGDKEKDNKTVSYRLFGHKETENLSLKEFEKTLLKQIEERR